MRVIYARQPLPQPSSPSTGILANSIFLAGPTPRHKPVKWWQRALAFASFGIYAYSWRPKALKHLKQMGFTGTVFVPEDEEWGLSNVIYAEQTQWEMAALGLSKSIVFWVPRNMRNMPALTTNVEFGFCVALAPGRTLLGAPPEAVKMGYLKQLAADINLLHTAFQSGQQGKTSPIRCFTSLEDILTAAVNFL